MYLVSAFEHFVFGAARRSAMLTQMLQDIPPNLVNGANRSVIAYVKDKSAHPDVVDHIVPVLKRLGDVQLFCPDTEHYRYVVASTSDVIFAFVTGMQVITFQLDPLMKSRALATGGEACPECGEEWAQFWPFRHDWPAVDWTFWSRKAYAHAREIAKLGAQ